MICCDPDATTWKLNSSLKDSRAKPLCKQAMLPPSTKASPNPWTVLMPKMLLLTKWKQGTDLALLGVQREFIFSDWHLHQSKTIKSWSGSGVIGAILGVSGRWDAKEVEAEGTKTKAERNEKGSPIHLNHRPRHILFWIKRGAPSVVGFMNNFLKGEFCHVRTQQWGSSFNLVYYWLVNCMACNNLRNISKRYWSKDTQCIDLLEQRK